MNCKLKTLFVAMAVIGIFLTFQINGALALDTEACQREDAPGSNQGQVCIGQLMPEDFGTFGDDGIFIPNEELYNEIGAWGDTEAMYPNFRKDWIPSSSVAPSYTRLDIRWTTDSMPTTRFMFQGGAITTWPSLWRVEGPNGELTGSFYGNFGGAPHEDCDDTQPMPNQDECAANFPQYAQSGGDNCDEVPETCYREQDGTPICSTTYLVADPITPEYVMDCENGPLVPCMDTGMTGCEFPPCNFCGPYPDFWDYNNPTMIADADVNACCKPGPSWINFETRTDDFITFNDVARAEWNGLTVLPKAARAFNFTFLDYIMGPNEIQDIGYSETSADPEVYFYGFAAGVIPEVGLNYVTVTLNDGSQFVVEFDVTSNFEMPTVAATYQYSVERVNKSGKVITTGQNVTAKNLVARELNGALVIQWAEPDGALTTPHMKLRIYVGDGWFTAEGLETFLFVNAPVQTGTVVIPAIEWQAFKQTMLDLGRTEVDVAGMYRMQTRYDSDNGRTDFHNRGMFEGIKFPIQ